MNKKALLLLTFASIVVSCQQAIETDPGSAPDILATVETDPATRTQLSVDWEGTGVISWMPADKINVFFGKAGAQYTSQNSLNATTAVFRTSDSIGIEEISSNNIWGLYPYNSSATCTGSAVTTTLPAVQAGVPETFDDDLYITLAHSTSTSLQFFNICSGIKFSLSRDDIKSISFRGNNNENLAGDISLTFENNLPKATVLKGVKEITLTPKSGETFEKDVNYYIITLPVTLSKGFTITFTPVNGPIGTFTYTDKSVTLQRSIFSKKTQLDTYASFVDESHEAVDLGLSVMWATCNVGASSPEEYGDHFAWGETSPKSDYSWNTFKWCNGSYNTLTKYNTKTDCGTVDNKTQLDLSDDVARANWGEKWRMPTDAEWTELLNNSTWTWTTQNGVYGRKVTSNTNGNSIFLPAAGHWSWIMFDNAGSIGYYWSSTLHADGPYNAFSMLFDSGGVGRSGVSRFFGHSVRPVYADFVEVSSISLDKTSVNLNVGESFTLSATVNPDNATVKDELWASSDPDIASVSGSGVVTANAIGTAMITAYASNGMSASCTVIVQEPTTGIENGYEWVNLGLSVKWASYNVGATKPEEYGDYFAWGETEPKSEYSWTNYKFRVTGDSWDTVTFSKYNTQSKYGTVDHKTRLELSDDAARANWGGKWRMPTDSEWTELQNNCTWTWTTQNGVNGRKVTSRVNGNSIFLPAAGFRYGTWFFIAGPSGNYWSSTLSTDSPNNAYGVYFSSSGVDRSRNDRDYGQSVRPVYGEFVEVSSISLNKVSANINVGESLTLTATVQPGNATAKDIYWSSSDTDIASVSASGVVTANAAGTATITAYASNGLSASCTVTVQNEAMVDWTTSDFVHKSVAMRFTATWCGWCPRMNKSVRRAQELYPDKISYVALHNSDSELAFNQVGLLNSQYKITGFPMGIVDGRVQFRNVAIEEAAESIVNAMKETEQTYGTFTGVDITSSIFESLAQVKVGVYAKKAGDYKITVLLLEDGIVHYQADYEEGDNSAYVHDCIARIAMSNVQGDSFKVDKDNSVVEFSFSANIPSSYNIGNMHVLVYIQRSFSPYQVIQSENYGDYFIDNSAEVVLGENLKLALVGNDGFDSSSNRSTGQSVRPVTE